MVFCRYPTLSNSLVAAVEKVGKYQILKLIGKGATSAVYLAHDPFAQREVALKVVNPEIFSDPQFGRRYQKLFLNEAALAGTLSHPHIVVIYDAVGDDQTGYYIAMEYVSGGTLEQHARVDKLLPVSKAVEIIFKCARALDYAYRQGVIHRDLKPANILFSEDGAIKISDFGAALRVQAETTQVSGIGSPAYMSPEQIKDFPLTHQSDIFSLGVVLYQLLTGKLPFRAGNSYGIAYQVLNTDASPPSLHRSEISPYLDRVVARALAKKPEQRYGTWEEFAQELVQAINQQEPMRPDPPELEKFDLLRKLPFFKHFEDIHLWEVVRGVEWKKYPPGTVLIQEGDLGRSFFILAAGRVRVVKQEKLLSTLGTGSSFGEMAYLAKQPLRRSASVIAEGPVTLIEVKPEALVRASEDCIKQFHLAFLEILSERLVKANSRLLERLDEEAGISCEAG
jgi:serine/threonine protein kinase